MNARDLMAFAPAFLPGTDEKKTLDLVSTLFGGFLKAKALQAVKPTELLALVKGEGHPSRRMVGIADMAMKALSHDEYSPMVMKMIAGFLETKGVSEQQLVGLAAMLGKSILPDVPVVDLGGVRSVLGMAVFNIINSDPHPEGSVYRCANCGDIRVIPYLPIST